MRVRAAVPLLLLWVLACGGEPEALDPLRITGQVHIQTWGDGGQVQTIASVSRILPDGGLLALRDAGVALNGVPLGAPDPESPGDEGQTWTRPAFQGVAYGAEQTLSVPGANPPASVSFTCPQQVVFVAPEEGARLERTSPVHLAWTAGGSPSWDLLLTFSLIQPLGGGEWALPVGFAFLEPGTLTYDLPFPDSDVSSPLEATGSFTLFAFGESPRSDSGCSSEPRRDVVFAPGQPVARAPQTSSYGQLQSVSSGSGYTYGSPR